eukprot:scaffold624_cov402-Prasinococcus_capsulatus_cf.AAC.67
MAQTTGAPPQPDWGTASSRGPASRACMIWQFRGTSCSEGPREARRGRLDHNKLPSQSAVAGSLAEEGQRKRSDPKFDAVYVGISGVDAPAQSGLLTASSKLCDVSGVSPSVPDADLSLEHVLRGLELLRDGIPGDEAIACARHTLSGVGEHVSNVVFVRHPHVATERERSDYCVHLLRGQTSSRYRHTALVLRARRNYLGSAGGSERFARVRSSDCEGLFTVAEIA